MNTVVIGLVSMVLLFFAVWLMDRLTPFSIRKEIEEDENISAAILCGAVVIGIAMVISSVAAG